MKLLVQTLFCEHWTLDSALGEKREMQKTVLFPIKVAVFTRQGFTIYYLGERLKVRRVQGLQSNMIDEEEYVIQDSFLESDFLLDNPGINT